ncbi:MAG: sigma-70 family RNA polymerase sigma factor [Burkholderiales bacterium]|nr:sigma-70 family RNA polymerase sigma factor [Burkholderiales bacterium]
MAISPRNNKESIYASPKMQAREQQLIAETAAGNEKAFEQLYQLYFNRLFQFVFRITRTQNGIEEVINDVMYVVWDKASTYNQICRPSTWILGIAYFKALKSIEKSIADEDRSVEFNDELDYFPDKGTDWISQLETSNWLEVAFKQLSTEQRAVVEMTYFQGLHYNEIAEIMQCPENTVKTRMFHARKILAKSLQQD